MNYRAIADEILRYYTEFKGRGHTMAVVESASTSKCIVVVASDEDRKNRRLRSVVRNHIVTFEQVEAGALREKNLEKWPLILDNGAVIELIRGMEAGFDQQLAEALKKTAKKDPK